MLRPGGRLLVRACRSAVAVPDDIDPAVIESVFRDWRIDQMAAQDIPSGTRSKLSYADHSRSAAFVRGRTFRGAGDGNGTRMTSLEGW